MTSFLYLFIGIKSAACSTSSKEKCKKKFTVQNKPSNLYSIFRRIFRSALRRSKTFFIGVSAAKSLERLEGSIKPQNVSSISEYFRYEDIILYFFKGWNLRQTLKSFRSKFVSIFIFIPLFICKLILIFYHYEYTSLEAKCKC